MADKQKQTGQSGASIERAEPASVAPFGGAKGAGSPFSFMRRMMEDLDQLFEDFGVGGVPRGAMPQGYMPQIEVFERDGKLLVRADLPGIKKEDVKVSVEDDSLLIEGERKSELEESREGFYHSERAYGSFSRRIPLPRGVDPSSCDASFDSGVLEIELALPKEKKKTIEVRAGGKGEPSSATRRGEPAEELDQNGTQAPPPRH